MKKCDRLEKALTNNDMSFREALAKENGLEAHIKICRDCAAYGAAFQKTEKLLAGLTQDAEEIDFDIAVERAKILSKIKAVKTVKAVDNAGIAAFKAGVSDASRIREISFFKKIVSALASRRFAAGLASVLLVAAFLFYSFSTRVGCPTGDVAIVKNAVEKVFSYEAVVAGGTVTVKRDGMERKLTAAQKVQAGSVVKTAVGARCSLNSKYAAVMLLPSSQAAVEELSVTLISGRTVMDFDKNALDGGKKFVVRLKSIAVEITGTAIEACVAGDSVSVRLINGKIKFSSPDFAGIEKVVLKPGETLAADASQKAFVVLGEGEERLKRSQKSERTHEGAAPHETGARTGPSANDTAPAVINSDSTAKKTVLAPGPSAGGEAGSGEISIKNQSDGLNDGISPFQSNY